MADNTLIRGASTSFGKVTENITHDVRTSQHRSLFVTEMEPRYMELARAKRLYAANTGAGTAKAPVTALPTTTSTWGLYNPTNSSRKLVPLKAYCYSVSGTLGLGMAILLGSTTSVVATPPSAYASSVSNALSPKAQTTSAVFANAVTVVAPTWNVHEARSQLSAIEVGSGLSTDCEGLYIIEPGHMMCGAVLAPTGTSALFGFGFIWAELDLDVG